VKVITAHLLDIPVVVGLSIALKFTLLIACSISQFASECVHDFLRRGGVDTEIAGIVALLVSMQVVSRGEEEHARTAPVLVPCNSFCSHWVQVHPPPLCAHCSAACGLVY
jgi:hypothetical protein